MPEDKLLKFTVQLLLHEASFFPTLNASFQAQKIKWIQKDQTLYYKDNSTGIEAQGRTRQEWFLTRWALNFHSSNSTEIIQISEHKGQSSKYVKQLLLWSPSALSLPQMREKQCYQKLHQRHGEKNKYWKYSRKNSVEGIDRCSCHTPREHLHSSRIMDTQNKSHIQKFFLF